LSGAPDCLSKKRFFNGSSKRTTRQDESSEHGSPTSVDRHKVDGSPLQTGLRWRELKWEQMKIYVTGFRIKPEYEEAKMRGEPIPNENIYDISYHVEPHWTFPYRELSESARRLLHDMQPHIGNHYCQLEVEQVEDEKYAIACNDHSEPKNPWRISEPSAAVFFCQVNSALVVMMLTAGGEHVKPGAW
jgi:hypothetical protein